MPAPQSTQALSVINYISAIYATCISKLFRCFLQNLRLGAQGYAYIILTVLSEDESGSDEHSCLVQRPVRHLLASRHLVVTGGCACGGLV